MEWYQITPITWKRLMLAFILIGIATTLRVWPLGLLENRLAWLTFYPAVMLAAIYGGVAVGMIAASLSCFILIFLWPLLTTHPFIKEPADWLGMAVFFLTCTMISFVAEAMRRANLRAKKAQEEAQIANQAKSIFLANMSHELRTPLNAILGYSQMMRRDECLSAEHKEFLKTINRSGEHLLSLINDILIIAKIESKGIALEASDFNFHMLIQELQKMFQAQVNEKNIVFKIAGLTDMPKYLYGDEKKLRIILINLIGNAVKFTHRGSVTLSLSFFKKASGQSCISVVVEDTGVGISETEITKLFKYFVQTESGKKSKTGTGLGLAISQDYIKLMGGEISATSCIDKGSIFHFTIEIDLGKEESNHESHTAKCVIGIKKGFQIPRILIAEDMEENRCLLVKLLSSVGFEVREAVNGKEAVEIFNEWHPDLIWMDIRMPVMDGLEATKLIRETKSGMDTKIVALSAHVLTGEVAEILNAGCDAFVGKPYRESEIFEVMAKKLNLEYVYKTMHDEESNSITTARIDNEQLEKMPEQLLMEFQNSVLALDREKILETIGKMSKIDNNLGISLKKLAESMDYTQLFSLSKSKKIQ
ncbi:response regulator [Pelosinus sp. sgz500959]|uniref:response regulator n=1 Tax=Pelosinus sp. sgz500959 TaxID=3242472 RepID=UPI00366D47CE